MAMRNPLQPSETQSSINRIARLQASPRERARILAGAPTFEYGAWLTQEGPPLEDELLDMEAFLQEREQERERNIVKASRATDPKADQT